LLKEKAESAEAKEQLNSEIVNLTEWLNDPVAQVLDSEITKNSTMKLAPFSDLKEAAKKLNAEKRAIFHEKEQLA